MSRQTVRKLTARLRASRIRSTLASMLALAAGSMALWPVQAGADQGTSGPASRDVSKLRICASAKQLPYSASDQSGFENKIAAIVAQTMGRQPEFVFTTKPAIYLVRDFLDKNQCDVVVGMDAGDARVLTTAPYYRAGYVFLQKKDSKIDVSSWNDPRLKSIGHMVVEFGSPGEVMLKEIGKYNDNMSYLYSLVDFRSPRNQYVQIAPQRIVSEVNNGDAALAVAFAPDIARFVKDNPALTMTIVADDATRQGGEKVPQRFDQSMGVRRGDTKLLAALNDALVKAQPQITKVLEDEGIPLVQRTQ
ncbi:methanol oxidation system protein MoxJ [Labrys sp. WJW]|uniref:methanol oxidation system protein MoxJ n=1 Tax=Labrys sp. WJW TaxID=1737983 RepID=UPI0008322A84|nr:methanol oxidation system protein MoxJ [Labrys sp. WJW]OCC05470.1 methanol oxidation system protein MoxJ [Labrys sp. WJW]